MVFQCDEQHPHCVNCTRADRICSYGLETPQSVPRSLGANSGSTSDTAASPSSEHSGRQVILTEKFDLFASPNRYSSSGDSDAINMNHLKLFDHFKRHTLMFCNVNQVIPIDQLKDTIIKEALSATYLMYECLAFSARHLSVQGPPEMTNFYLDQAMKLQTRALAIFNESPPSINDENCIAVFMFSNFLGQHSLVDTLAFRDSSLEKFLDHFINYLSLHRGARAISSENWPFLMNSKLRPIFLEGMESKESPEMLIALSPLSQANSQVWDARSADLVASINTSKY